MKKFTFIILLLTLSALTYFYEQSGNYSEGGVAAVDVEDDTVDENFPSTQYIISTSFEDKNKLLRTNQIVYWVNTGSKSTDEIQFHLYANGFKNSKTEIGKSLELSEESITGFQFSSILVNGVDAEIKYFHPEAANPFDSTTAKILLKSPAKPGDTVKIEFNYTLKIPLSSSGLGYASGAEFYFFSRWYPKIAVYKNDKWICSQLHSFTEEFNEFADYNVSIEAPGNLSIASNGILYDKTQNGSNYIFSYSNKNITEFVWSASEEFKTKSRVWNGHGGKKIQLNAYLQPGHENYDERIFEILDKSLSYFEQKIGKYPYDQINVLDVPRTFGKNSNSFPCMITMTFPLFSPTQTHIFEKEVIRKVAKQYFSNVVASNSVYTPWLSSGVAEYLTIKVLKDLLGESRLYFNLVGYVPVYGILFTAYKEIPIVYSLTDVYLPEGTESYQNFYANPTISISDTAYKLPDDLSYSVSAIHKPVLMFLSLEKILGKELLFQSISKYYLSFRFQHPESDDLLKNINDYSSTDLNWFVDDVIKHSRSFDYKIKSVSKNSNNEYEVFVERLGEGIFQTEVALYTEHDALIQRWDGKDSWKIFKFKTDKEVIAAEIDPFHKNVLDVNFPNNSYTVNPQYWASISLAVRWFFWIQNALMILGSIG
ncbi:MAG: hypothetical protein V1720_22625 [bacterium]